MDNGVATSFLLGGEAEKYTYFVYNPNEYNIFENKDYFNKWTTQIVIFNARLGNEYCQVINKQKEVLIIKVEYTINYFGESERRYRVKDYIYIDNKLYRHDKDIKRVPNEVKCVIDEYLSMIK